MTDIRAFRKVCYEAARRTAGTVAEFRVPDVTPNYYLGIIEYRDRTVAVAGGRDDEILAVAEPVGDSDYGGPLTFVDFPELVAVLAEQPGYRVLTAAELGEPFEPEAHPRLNPTDVEYWKPETVGEALFNDWD